VVFTCILLWNLDHSVRSVNSYFLYVVILYYKVVRVAKSVSLSAEGNTIRFLTLP